MTKKKKKLNTKINPEKSNKMIIAVAIGVVIVMAAFLIITILSGGGVGKAPADKKAFMEKEMEYLKTTDGIAALKLYPEQNKVVIIFEGYKESKHDYAKIAWYAAYKLSRSMGGEDVTVQVAKDTEEHLVHSYTLKDGKQVAKKVKN